MSITTTAATDAWVQILRGDEFMQEYFAVRSTLGNAALFTCAEADEFNLALVDRVPSCDAENALTGIVSHYQNRGATPRIRVSPLAAADDWPERLVDAGFLETGECRRFWTIPDTVQFSGNPDVVVSQSTTPEEADLYSAIQTAGFGVPPDDCDWDRALARLHVAAGRYRFYMGWLDGQALGVASSVPIEYGVTGLWGIATIPSARKQGIGTAILQRMLEDARAAGSGLNFFTTTWGNSVELTYTHLGCISLFQTRTFRRTRSLL